MQLELNAGSTPLGIDILGINVPDSASGNETFCMDRDIPWLQPTAANDPTSAWGATYRDVVILDAQNRFVEAFNLTAHDLRTAWEYEDLKARLEAAATP